MPCMRKLTQEYKLAARTAREVYEDLSELVLRASGRVKFRGRKLGNEAAINAAVMFLLDQPPERRDAILADYVRRFEALLDDGPAPAKAMDAPAVIVENRPVEPPRRKGRAG